MELLKSSCFEVFLLTLFLIINAHFFWHPIGETIGVGAFTHFLVVHLMLTAVKAFEVVTFFRIRGLQIPQITFVHV